MSPIRVVAIAVLLFGATACFLWGNYAARTGQWWQVAAAAAIWFVHAIVFARMWRAGKPS